MNKPNDVRVSRELLERVSSQELGMTAQKDRQAAAQELRALLDQPADQQGEPVAERYPIVGKFYTWRSRGRCEYIGPTRYLDGWIPTFRFKNGKDRAMNPEQFSSHIEEFSEHATANMVLPERMSREKALSLSDYPPENVMYWWNACLDEVAKLNGGQS